MPQVSLYIDSETMKKIESEAKRENLSISHWVRSKIQKSLNNDWPGNHSSLFGSIKDDSFVKPESLNFKEDSKRLVL